MDEVVLEMAVVGSRYMLVLEDCVRHESLQGVLSKNKRH